MKCSACGYENPEGSKFCSECGTKLEKRCPGCGEPVAESAKFCPNCGTRLDSAASASASASGIAMGDKNIIAGDVYGSKEDYHISGNATIIKNTDETRKVLICSICGKHLPMSDGYTCPDCGRFVCSSCFDSNHGKCIDCTEKDQKRREEEYTEVLRKEISGPLSKLKLQELTNKGQQYGLTEDKASQLIKNVLATAGTSMRAEMLTQMEKDIISAACDNLYEKWNISSANEQYGKVYSVYEQHKNEQRVLDILIPILLIKNKEYAKTFISDLATPSATLFCARIDIALYENKVVEAINIMEEAKLSFGNDIRIKAKEVELLLKCGAVLGLSKHTENARQLAAQLPNGETKLERSLAFRAKLLAGIYSDIVVDKKYFETNDLYSGYCSIPFCVGSNRFCQYSTLMEAVNSCPIGGVIHVYPGDYFEELELKKPISITAIGISSSHSDISGDTKAIIHIKGNKTVTIGTGVVLKNLVLTHSERKDLVQVDYSAGNALLCMHNHSILAGCLILKSNSVGISIEEGSPIIDGCIIIGTGNSGIVIQDKATPHISNTMIGKCADNAIMITGGSAPRIENCSVYESGLSGFYISGTARPEIRKAKIENCGGNGIESRDSANPSVYDSYVRMCNWPGFDIGDISTGKYENCSSRSNKQSGYLIQGSANPEMVRCIADGNLNPGFIFDGRSFGKYRNCSSKSNKQTGYWIQGAANPRMEECIAENNGYRGFEIQGKATGKYSNCSSKLNKQCGYWIRETANPEMLGCVAEDNAYSGFIIAENAIGKYNNCISKSNRQDGYWVKGIANPEMNGCIAVNNEQRGFYIQYNATGQYSNCKAESNKNDGYLICGAANPAMVKCVAESNGKYGSGFAITEDATGRYDSCNSSLNEWNGYNIKDAANPEMIGCLAENNQHCGFGISGSATGNYSNCISYRNSFGGYLMIDTVKPVMTRCLAESNRDGGFSFEGSSTGKYNNCSSKENWCGFSIRGTTNLELLDCIAENNHSSGFDISEKATGKYHNCCSKSNVDNDINRQFIYAGYMVHGMANPEMVDCIAEDNNGQGGVVISEKAKGLYVNCFSKNNISQGFSILENANPSFRNCVSQSNNYCGYSINNDSSVSLDDCLAEKNSLQGFWIGGKSNSTLNNCNSSNNKKNGFCMVDSSSSKLINCTAEANKQSGFILEKMTQVHVISSSANSNGNHGFEIRKQSSMYKDTFENCIADNNKAFGFAYTKRSGYKQEGCTSNGKRKSIFSDIFHIVE